MHASTGNRHRTHTPIRGIKDPDWMTYDNDELTPFTVQFLGAFLTAVMRHGYEQSPEEYTRHGVIGANARFSQDLKTALREIAEASNNHTKWCQHMRPILQDHWPEAVHQLEYPTNKDKFAQVLVIVTYICSPSPWLSTPLSFVPWRLTRTIDREYLLPMHPQAWLQSLYDDRRICDNATPGVQKQLTHLARMLGTFEVQFE